MKLREFEAQRTGNFSLAVLEKIQGFALAKTSSLSSSSCKSVTFLNISVITEDIFLKLGVCVHYPKSNPCYQGRQFKMHFFLQNYAPFLT